MHQPLFIFLLGFIPIVGGTDANNYFRNPSFTKGGNMVWTLGDEQVISWQTTLEMFNISIWQQSLVEQGASSQGNIYSKIHSTDQVTNFTWAVQLYGFDLDYSNVFFLWLNPDGPDGFVSAFFNITKPTSTSTSTFTSTSTTAAATPVSTSTNPPDSSSSSSSLSSAAPAAQASSSSPGLTSTGQVALGVGIGIGVPVLGALAVLIWFKARQPNRNGQMAAASGIMPPSGPMMQQQQRPPSPPKEVHGVDPRDYYPELPSQQHQ